MFRTSSRGAAAGLAILRVVVGIMFLVHGWQKVFGMGHAQVAGFFGQSNIPLHSLSAWIVMVLELIGGFLLAIGLLTRVIAALFAFEMLVAVAFVHFKNGFFLPNGYEYALVLFAVAIAFVLAGPGAPSVDEAIAGRHTERI